MRKYHRWLAPLFGLFILWIAATGVVVGAGRLYASGESERARPTATAPAPAQRPPQSPTRQFIHFVTELHSGEQFGLAGQLISLVSGLALVFFAVSGLWMYLQMARGRLVKARDGKPLRGGKLFWS
jgi:PepSY-associated TM region